MPQSLKRTQAHPHLHVRKAPKAPRGAINNPLQQFMAFCSEHLKHSKSKPDLARARDAARLLRSIPENQIDELINETRLAGNNLLIIAILQEAKLVAEGLIPSMTGTALCGISHNHMSAVSAACKMGYENILESIFEQIIKWHTERNEGSGIPECKKLVHYVDSKGNTPLILAARTGNTRMCFTLLKYANSPLGYLRHKNHRGESAMSIVAAQFADQGADDKTSHAYMDLFQFLQKKEEDLTRLSLTPANDQNGFYSSKSFALRANRLLIWPPLASVRQEEPRPISRKSTASSSSLESDFPTAPST